jgi:hypothetical protein
VFGDAIRPCRRGRSRYGNFPGWEEDVIGSFGRTSLDTWWLPIEDF